MRTLCLLAFGIFVGLFAYTYNLKLKTRALEAEARELVNTLQDEGDFLALMRAEVSYLSRPERIEDMARKDRPRAIQLLRDRRMNPADTVEAQD